MSVEKHVNRDGSVSWKARVRLADGRGRSRRFPTRRQADAWEREQLSSRDRGAMIDPAAARAVTVGEWLTQWYGALPSSLASSTRSLHDGNIRNHIAPVVGGLKLASLRPSHLQRALEVAIAKGLADNSVRRIHETMRQAFGAAVDEDMIGRNPALRARPPAAEEPPKRFLGADELHRLADAIDPRFAPLVLTLGYVGLRFGEAAGLLGEDVDLDRRRASIVGQVSADKLNGGRLERRKPKTRTSQRTVALPAVERAELAPLTPHELRHTAASLMIRAGADVLEVQRQLGHRNAAITLRTYAHLFDDRLDSLADRMGVYDRDPDGGGD